VRGRKFLVVWLVLGIWLLTWGGEQKVAAETAKLDRVVYITLSKACGCLVEKCKAGDLVVERVFVGERQGLLKRIDYSTDKATAREYIRKYHLTYPPSLLFLDARGNLIWRADGDVDYDAVLAKLKEFGA
jgi:hypothetical protein